jgi:hypothetical protein
MPEIVTSLSAEALAQSHKVSTLVEVLTDGEVVETVANTTEGNVSYDANSAARARLDMTVAGCECLIPLAEDSLLAPYGNEIRVSRGIGDQLIRLGVFRIDRSSVVSQAGESVRVSCSDRASRFIAPDGAFETPGSIASGQTVGDAIITDVLLPSWPDMPYDATAFDAVTVPLPAIAWEEAEDRWAFASGLAQSIGAELYFDRDGSLTIQPVPTAASGNPVATIAEGEGGSLLSVERDIDRGPVVNRWIVTGENTDEDAPVRGEAIDDNPLSPTYYYGRFGKKLDTYANSFITTANQANDAAAGLLARSIGRPDVVSFSALVDPARNPSDVIRIEREVLGLAEEHILDTVSIPLSAEGEMSGQTRATQILS